ncbi:NDP-sugar synthase [Candidatus Saganbacteria bacterium]|nr:NDP-sugar synthase [Candidatus Saganbacteria bacterium]
MKAVIIAGGLGTRLRPLTYNTPKPIVPVANRAFVIHQIEHLKRHGVSEIILNLHYLPDAIKQVLGDGSQFGVKLFYSIESDPLGTAGAVKNAEEYFGSDLLIVFNGDVLTDLNISKMVDFHRQKKAKATIALTPVEDPTAYGLVLTGEDSRVKEFLEKPNWERLEGIAKFEINAGTYVIDPKVFKDVPKNTRYMFEHDLFPKLLMDRERVFGYSSASFWLDIGNIAKYKHAHEAILRGEVAVRVLGMREDGACFIGRGAKVAKSAKLISPVLVGEEAAIMDGAVIKDYSVVGSKVAVGANSTVENSIIWDNSSIGEHVKLSQSIVGYNCRIEDNCSIRGVVLADNSLVAKGTIFNA